LKNCVCQNIPFTLVYNCFLSAVAVFISSIIYITLRFTLKLPGFLRMCSVVIMEGDPHPGALKGRMSFQSFNPSVDVS